MIAVEINDFPITQVATKLSFKIINSDAETVTIYYELSRADGVVVERNNEIFPRTAIAAIASDPIDINALNQLLAVWGLSAKV